MDRSDLELMEIAFFAPTSFGDVAAVAHLPATPVPAADPVLLLTGGRAGKRVIKLLGERLSRDGCFCLRFDYPGSGAATGMDPLPRAELLQLATEIGEWWLHQTEGQHLTVVGRCLGARLGVAMAARDDTVKNVVGISLPVPQRSLARRLKRGVRAMDARGPRLATKLVQGPRVVDRGRAQDDGVTLEPDLRAAAHARFRFLFGADDAALATFRRLLDSAPDEMRNRVHVAVLPDARLRGIPDIQHEGWVQEQVADAVANLHGAR